MRTIIAGSRSTTPAQFDFATKFFEWIPSVVLCGDARGADRLGAEWAERNKIPVEHYPADWSQFGMSAGYRRNEQMANNAQALIAIWDGFSLGTKHMIDIAHRLHLKVHIIQDRRTV